MATSKPTMNHRIALVLDGEVVDVIVADARHAAILLSKPTIIDVTNYSEEKRPFPGWKFDAEKSVFSPGRE